MWPAAPLHRLLRPGVRTLALTVAAGAAPVALAAAGPLAGPWRPAAGGPGSGAPPRVWRAEAGTVTFRIEDRRDPRELAEQTAVFVNGRRVGEFHLDDAEPAGALTVTVPAAPSYEYALCGSITLRAAGGEEMHRVNSAGRLSRVDGRVFEAMGAADFTRFYLVDRGGEDAPDEGPADQPAPCTPATS